MDFGGKNILSPALFAVILLLFLMPFVEVSCSGQKIASLTGYDLAFGYEPVGADVISELGGSTAGMEKEGPEWPALLGFGAALAGIGVGFMGDPKMRTMAGAICGIVGALMMFFIMIGANGRAKDVAADSAGLIETSLKFGLFASLLVFAGAAVVNVLESRGRPIAIGALGSGMSRQMGGFGGPGTPGAPGGPGGPSVPGGPGMPPPPPAAQAGTFCPKCGTKNAPGHAFCESCGERLG